MASFIPHIPLAFLLFLAATALQTQARESRSFSKAVRYEAPKETTPVPADTPSATKEEPAKFPPQSQNGYGLYGRGPYQFPPPTTTNNYVNNNPNGVPSRFQNNEFAGESYRNRESTAGYQNYYNDNNAAYRTGAVPSKTTSEEFIGSSYKNTESNTMYPKYADPKKPYGMSDTRVLENGRYYYDVNAERYPNKYEPTTTRENSEGYGVGTRGDNYGYGGYNYGGKGNAYEYSNAMEGYQNNQQNEENPEEYVP